MNTFLKRIFDGALWTTMNKLPMMVKATVFVVLVCLSLVLVDGWRTYNARVYEMKIAETTTTNLARALAQHAEDSIKEADTILIGLVERLEVDGIFASRDRLHLLLMKHVAELPQLHGLFVYDSDGRWVVNALPHMPANMNNSDRDYFQYHRTHTDRGPHIDVPVRSRSTGQWIITISRRVNHADGSFAGVALATIDVTYFQKFYENFDIGRSGVIFLALENGIYLARRPFKESLIGKSLSTSRLFNEYLPKAPVGTAIVTSVADNVERLYAYRHLEKYPLVMFAALSTEEIYAKWLADTRLHSAIVALLAITLGGLGFRLIRQIQFREHTEAQLVCAQDDMEKLNKKLEILALEDGLTELANRRQFDVVLNNNFQNAMRNSRSLALVMIDVDHFKRYNDIYGHPAGDICLKTISNVVKKYINRPNDLAARYGGEEIVVLLPDTQLAGAVVVADKIRSAICNLEIAHSDNTTGFVTISAGVSALVPIIHVHTTLEFIRSADKALYAAKHKGRNTVCTDFEGEISRVTGIGLIQSGSATSASSAPPSPFDNASEYIS